MEIFTGCAKVAEFMYKNIELRISYVFHHKRRVVNFEEKVETLKERRDRVQHDVDSAKRNAEKIETEVNNWLIKVDNMLNAEVNQVRDLQDRAESKCFMGLCPNFLSRYQLSKKADEDANNVNELLQQGQFDKVSYRDDPQAIEPAFPKNFEAFDSREQMFNEILEAIRDPSINVIGVYGMAGVGKTTLVKEVARQVKEDKSFDSVVIVAASQNPDIQKIQGEVAGMLGLKFEEQNMTRRASRLCRLKQEKKILVVLDDIWARLDLMEVGIPFGDEHRGCTVLLISRDLYVLLNDMEAQKKFEIGILRQEEAWSLFRKRAGSSIESSHLMSTATQVAKKCAGLPIAISAVAKSLRNKGSFAWRDALRQLNQPSSSNFSGVPADAYKAIELSYNYLECEEVKQIFLLCCQMGHNAYLQDLLKYVMGLGLFHGVRAVEETRDRLLTVVSHLKASCLLLDSYDSLRFDMHDLIRDVARSIASRDNSGFFLGLEDGMIDWSDKDRCHKISLRVASSSELPDKLKCPKLTFLYIYNMDPSSKIPTEFFEETINLKVLDLTNMHIPSLPLSICVLAHLRTLCLDQCALGDIAIVGELKKFGNS